MAQRKYTVLMFMIWFLTVTVNCFELSDKFEACKTCECRVSTLGISIRCRGRSLSSLPKDLPMNITALDLSDNLISTLPTGCLSNLTYLRYLYLHNNRLKRLPREIFHNLKYLQTLNLKNNKLEELPELPTSLVYLYIDNNSLTQVPTTIKNLTKLRRLNLDLNDISNISKDAFKPLKELEYLNICCNQISNIQAQSFPESLINLDLRDNVLTSVPTKSLKTLVNLQHLDLDENPIRCIHNKAFDGLKNLSELSIKWDKVVQVENQAFYGLPQLRQLSLVNVSLKRFPNLTGTTSLQILTLDVNNISSLPLDFCERFPHLQQLNANMNKITRLPDMSKCSSLEKLELNHNSISSIDLRGMSNLKEISLKDNKITYISNNAFQGVSKLTNLILAQNMIKDIPDDALRPLTSLLVLNLRRNDFTTVPTKALRSLKTLQNLDLDGNPIKEVHNYAFEGLKSLTQISLSWDKVEKVDHGAFMKLPCLKQLSLVNVKLKRFPDLTDTNALQVLILESNSISSLPSNFCEMFPKLYNFNANMNRITSLPDMSKCSSMVLLHLVFNRITSIGASLQGMSKLKDITLKENSITSIPTGAFKGNKKLESLNLAHNKITFIAEDAFVPLESLTTLDLSYNNFPKLPTKGMKKITRLKLRGNKRLNEISAESLPNVRVVEASYPYHCCQFRKKIHGVPMESVDKKTSITNKGWAWSNFEGVNFLIEGPGNETVMIDGDDELSGFGSAPIDPAIIHDGEGPEPENPTQSYTSSPGSEAEIVGESWESTPLDVNCTPLPDPFFPCEDLMGSWGLRVGVWCVFMLALLGNAVVVIVIILSKTKIDVSKFLIINLAVADLCMGVYLGCLAIVDASTIGDFMHHGVDWQQSVGCKTAGFLAVLSSEASVFTLAVITIERFIAIRHALHVDRKMSLRKTAIVMAGGWLLAFIIATLPLLKVSDYTKFSICLPFETGDVQSLVFVTLLLSMNLIAFVVIFGCYVRIYFEIRGSNAWNTSDTQVAMRMALLVVTDFTCWAPIVIIALPAAFGSTFVSLEQAKLFTVFIFPLNSCANPFLYAIFTYQFKKDCLSIFRRVKNSPVPPMIQITLTKKRLSMSGIPVELRQGSRASDLVYAPETHSDGKMTLRVPSFKFNRRYSLPAAFKLSAGAHRASRKSSGAESSDENSKCSNENSTEQTMVEKPKHLGVKDDNINAQSKITKSKSSNEISTEKQTPKERKILIDRRTAV